jgi:hypothetical protein
MKALSSVDGLPSTTDKPLDSPNHFALIEAGSPPWATTVEELDRLP